MGKANLGAHMGEARTEDARARTLAPDSDVGRETSARGITADAVPSAARKGTHDGADTWATEIYSSLMSDKKQVQDKSGSSQRRAMSQPRNPVGQ